MSKTLIKGGTVIPVTGRDAIFPGGVVLTEGDKILYAGPAEGAPSAEGAKVIDATGHIVMPGIVNTHCHTAMTLLRGYGDDLRLMEWLQTKMWPTEAKMVGEDIYWGTALGNYEMLSGGITTVLNMYFYADDEARAITDTGIRGIIARGIIAVGGPGEAKTRLDETRDAFHRWNGKADGRISFMVGPHAPYTCPPDVLLACKELADELNIPIHTHLSETAFEVENARKEWGVSPIEHVYKLGLMNRHLVAAHCVHVDDNDIAILKETGAGVAHCPVSNLKLASGIAPVTKMRRAGVQLGYGTDGASSENQLHILGSEMRLGALLAKNYESDPAAFTSYDAIEMATIGGARALGMGAQIGTLEAGKQADIAIIRADRPHLVPNHDPYALVAYSVLPGDVAMTLVAGQVVYEHGKLTRMDSQEIMAKADERAKALVR